ncbi:hypothetical protein [Sphingomonas sanxanigenens]|uniref:hypothetical protein n=1 Tax=Sphingomonas sanxanigenens TaxID=397260 RepID=UPI0013014E2B|nr:hypothetical protein [Sphingomonas sanxanigenens]
MIDLAPDSARASDAAGQSSPASVRWRSRSSINCRCASLSVSPPARHPVMLLISGFPHQRHFDQ